ncbi:Putative peptidoglycan binding domain-containing protein [Thermodesulforhabdus norvegica]|uniref:Putative peptidoglycan binding domain-containing protein n=1 Tax=Thermodesulforhabdus norvegica TaxID=39841 RepID=A0A1I4UCE0_9BACT|nr:Putative peptidoglycan binding domain-containing protein [Thermodesulforhabdus norvegica]
MCIRGNIRSGLKFLVLLYALSLFLHPAPARAGVCYGVKDLTSPKLSELMNLSKYFSEPLENRIKAILEEGYATRDQIAKILEEHYLQPEITPFFFTDDLNPVPTVTVLKDFVNYYVFYEDAPFPEFSDLDRILRETEFLKVSLARNTPELESHNIPLLCASGYTQQGFYLRNTELPPDRQQQILAWAGSQLQKIERFTGALIKADMTLTALLVRYHLITRPGTLVELPDIGTLRDPNRFRDYLLSLHPSNHHYQLLMERIAFYRDLAGQEQVFLTDSTTLKKGMSGHPVLNLQKRLNQEGFLPDEAVNGIFDELTQSAVVKFQGFHNLEQDGVVGPRTRAALNIPYSTKLRWIRESLRRMRFFLKDDDDIMVWVNIPTFSLEYYRRGTPVSRHKIIVGEASGRMVKIRRTAIRVNNTPTLSSEIKAVVVNPRWYVPERIRKELEEEIAKKPDYLEQGNFRFLTSQYSWGQPRIYQLPGETNPLGRVKFLFDNPFGIFLHDTSQPRLFNRAYRAFSHGCVRVENALDLARFILSDAAPHQLPKLEAFLARKDQTYIVLLRPIPIYITYLPVLSDGRGSLVFGGDPYGWGIDEKLPTFFYRKRK